MNDWLLFILLSLMLAFLPPAIGLCRRLDDWTMIRVWLWLLLPVLGWFIALALALDSRRR